MNIKQIHDFIDFVTAKERGGFNSPAEKNQAVDTANKWLFNDCIQRYAVDTWANEALAPFKKKPYLDFETDATGAYAIDAAENFAHLLAIQTAYVHAKYGLKWQSVRIVNEDELADRLSSVLHAPSQTNPCAVIQGGVDGNGKQITSYQLYPEQVLAGRIFFLRQPKEPKLVETQAGRVFTYDPVNSVDLEWAPQHQTKVIFKALELLGINMDSDKLVQYADALGKQNI